MHLYPCSSRRWIRPSHSSRSESSSRRWRDLADAARAIDVTRARMTQVMGLLLLAPEIQEAILDLPPVTNGRDPVSERALRRIVAEPDWDEQRALWSEVQRCEG